MLSVLMSALSAITAVADRDPFTTGLKVKLTVQLALGANAAAQVLVWVKSPASAPVKVMPVTVIAVNPKLVMVFAPTVKRNRADRIGRRAKTYSETRVDVSRNHSIQVDATIRERGPRTKLNKTQLLWFRSNSQWIPQPLLRQPRKSGASLLVQTKWSLPHRWHPGPLP